MLQRAGIMRWMRCVTQRGVPGPRRSGDTRKGKGWVQLQQGPGLHEGLNSRSPTRTAATHQQLWQEQQRQRHTPPNGLLGALTPPAPGGSPCFKQGPTGCGGAAGGRYTFCAKAVLCNA